MQFYSGESGRKVAVCNIYRKVYQALNRGLEICLIRLSAAACAASLQISQSSSEEGKAQPELASGHINISYGQGPHAHNIELALLSQERAVDVRRTFEVIIVFD